MSILIAIMALVGWAFGFACGLLPRRPHRPRTSLRNWETLTFSYEETIVMRNLVIDYNASVNGTDSAMLILEKRLRKAEKVL